MLDVLDTLRTCEYMSENYEDDHYPDATQEEIQQSRYEYLYFRDLADHLEIMIKRGIYSDEQMIEKVREKFNQMYSNFQKSSAKSIETKKKATCLKMNAFNSVYGVLEDALAQV